MFQALDQVLGLYSNIAISWVVAVVADLVINKPLGLSPKGIEFRRAYLYDINPVGVGAMLLALVLSVAAFAGLFGAQAQAFSAFIARLTALVTSPAIAWATRGKYYIARAPQPFIDARTSKACRRAGPACPRVRLGPFAKSALRGATLPETDYLHVVGLSRCAAGG